MAPGLGLDKLPGSLPSQLVPEDVDVEIIQKSAQKTLDNLGASGLQNSALWRDWLALTGQIRTFYSSEKIAEVWNGKVKSQHVTDMKTKAGRITKPVPTSSWVDIPFTFITKQESGLVGNCTGTASLTPDEDGKWKIWMLVTILENFADQGHPDIPRAVNGALGNGTVNGVNDHQKRSDGEDRFDVVVIGAGQCGLAVAGRLAALGVDYVLLEKRPAVGKNWTQRYESVRQHTVREYNNLPFERTWKPNDPLLLPGKIVAEGFENYVRKYNINIWTSVDTTGATWVPESRLWTLDVTVNENEKRRLVCRHLVLATGAGVSVDNDPKYPGTDQYQGTLLHSGAYKHSRDWATKDGIVIGSGTTAHDIAEDMYRAGLRSVTMIQRNKTAIYPIEWIVKGQQGLYNNNIPTADADALVACRPNKILRDILKVIHEAAASQEQGRFDDLERAGFRVDRKTPLMDNILSRYGGYYIDIGASSHIVRGDIKVKSGVPITTFTSTGLKFEDGSEIQGDVVVIATGQDHDYRNQVAEIVGKDFASKLSEFWGLDEEGEVRNVMKPAAPGFWMFGGTAAQARWWSRFVALSIQSDVLGKPLEGVKMAG
ncbi:uncharacterized protein Z519_08443 [Cladophialophora bantiana CBS 173.52]|uniref:FAD/NAD(P)-binding domain-containing protein n=1 Tax=Cladophialophora bantiana (strain ATCC 10958 / CBS 173.52 / CDC B-1940 / NIH 8579) TaxID=1442370 RepID=A0A0D2HIT1_CLAB1|nr:uncharacterized protein Z519_08443 [Cladophialophora bantiana CBS 173.52]KIW90660.1 hypothetical protein Z519_08443 [Cladophialophora bantiana CBS 173.52]